MSYPVNRQTVKQTKNDDAKNNTVVKADSN